MNSLLTVLDAVQDGLDPEWIIGGIAVGLVGIGTAIWKTALAIGRWLGKRGDTLVDKAVAVFDEQSRFVKRAEDVMGEIGDAIPPLLDRLDIHAEHLERISEHYQSCPWKGRLPGGNAPEGENG